MKILIYYIIEVAPITLIVTILCKISNYKNWIMKLVDAQNDNTCPFDNAYGNDMCHL